MPKTSLTALAVLIAAMPMPSFAQVTVLDGKYTDNNVVRVVARVKLPAPPASAYRVAMIKVATMTGQKGFARFAVVKIDDCGTLSINNSPIVQTCKIFGQMLGADETAQPNGKQDPKYYTVQGQAGGLYMPTAEN